MNLISSFEEKIKKYPEEERKLIFRGLYRLEELQGEKAPTAGEGPEKHEMSFPLHSLETAKILADLGLDADTVTAGLLVDHGADAAETEKFGRGVSFLLEETAKTGDIQAKNKTVREAENIRKMLFAMSRDIRVIFIKLAGKLAVLRTLDAAVPGARAAAQECLDIYAPLADRLGISWIKDELEDLALKQINREAYRQIKKLVAEKRGERQDFLVQAQDAIRKEAEKAGIPVEVSSRAKHFYSIYQKMRKRNKASENIFDLFGMRIICDSIENCYTLLGIAHRLNRPLDGRFKDYIAMPKSNGYQSLHTTVISPGGKMLEIQIRTTGMHHIAEYGLASHWLYKKGSVREIVRPVDLSIVGRLRNWKQAENEGGEKTGAEFLRDIKRELLGDSIYVFTPQGDIVELPAGATPIDFAYSIHTAVGEHCIGAKADGAIIPLRSELGNTQVVEILTAANAHPHINWLRLVKTSKARNKIRSWLEQNDDSVVMEKNAVPKKKDPAGPDALHSEESPAGSVPQPAVQQVMDQGRPPLHVRVEDEKNFMIHFARCCRPVTGDSIIGYVSRGRGIIIHRKNCGNLAGISDFSERKIEVEWENACSALVKRFRIEARLSSDLFSEIEGAVRKHQGHLVEGRLEETAPGRLTGFFTMQLESADSLKRIMKNMRGIPGMLRIQLLG
ncbi:MAG: HD domain-containing protein [Treponema sp.]|jgi:GTP pyrophosphokinase|nr:HD domain-containing protein [Treponema sp.]